MKNNFKAAIAVALLPLTFLSCQTSKNAMMKKIAIPKQVYGSGVEFIPLRDKTLPYTRVYLWSSYGIAHENLDKQGALNLVTSLFQEGSKNKTKDQIAKEFAALGSGLSISPGMEQTLFTAESLTSDSHKLAKLFTEVILKSEMSNKSILDIKKKTISKIKKSYDDPDTMASKAFKQTIFKDHPYSFSQLGLEKKIGLLRRADLKETSKDLLTPSRLKVILVGNWTAEAEAHLMQRFSELAKSYAEEPKVLTPASIKAQTLFYHKPGIKQANIHMGINSIARDNKDYYALRAGLFILGGSFKSKLNEELRVKRGLTYGVNSYLDSKRYGGLIVVKGATRHEKIEEFILEAKKILKETAENGITQEELDKAKIYFKSQFPASVETKEKLVSQFLSLESKGVSGEKVFDFIQEMDNLTLDQVNKALKDHFVFDHLNTVIYGDVNKARSHMRKIKYDKKNFRSLKL